MNITTEGRQICSATPRPRRPLFQFVPLFLFIGMTGCFLLLDAILPLYGLFFHPSLLNWLSPQVLLPAQLLFPTRSLSPTLFSAKLTPPTPLVSWQDTFLLLTACVLLLLFYLLALRYLPGCIKRRSILASTLCFGFLCVLTPMVSSQDIFSYIIYARIGIIYHLNPLATTPLSIPNDPTYHYLYWHDQPSAYGPTWAIITCLLQFVSNLSGYTGTRNVALMALSLRLLGLAAHLWSTLLVWSIGGYLQQTQGKVSQHLRIQATLAFAWNPLLLFEACVNGHNDTVLLLFVLFAIWALVRRSPLRLQDYLYATIMLALATSLKVTIILLLPGFFFFLWQQPRRFALISSALGIYLSTILLLYLPFWQGGAILNLFHVNPGTYRNSNTLAEFLTRLVNSVIPFMGGPVAAEIGSPVESSVHSLSLLLFVGSYGFLCWQALFTRQLLQTPLHLLRWLTLAWFLYCLLGSPWFWPWYTITFFGLLALLETVDYHHWKKQAFLRILYLPYSTRFFSFSLLSLYCFYTWIPYNSTIPAVPGFRWAFFRGLWTWLAVLIPLLAMPLTPRKAHPTPAETKSTLDSY